MFTAGKKIIQRFPSEHLSGPRVFLRAPSLQDWRAWAALRELNRDHLEPFEPLWAEDFATKEFFVRRLQRQLRDWQNGQSRSFLVFKNDKRLIGGMNVNNICRGAAQFASLGYWIDKNHEGKGYMREALQLTLKYCFENLRLHRVNASCIPGNDRSSNLLVRAGFREEGFAEKYLQINGTWYDHILYGLNVEDWSELKD